MFDPQSLRLCIDSIAAMLSMVCVPGLVTPRSHNFTSLTVVNVASCMVL